MGLLSLIFFHELLMSLYLLQNGSNIEADVDNNSNRDIFLQNVVDYSIVIKKLPSLLKQIHWLCGMSLFLLTRAGWGA